MLRLGVPKKEKLQIDQSGKIEQTNVNTVVALANGKYFTVVLRKKDKRIIEKIFKKIGKIKSYPYIVFASLVAILLKEASVKQRVVVDREYIGHENTIRERVLHYLLVLGENHEPMIVFGHVGKLSRAHDTAAKVGSKKIKPNKIVSIEEVLELVLEVKPQKKTEVIKD